MTLVFDRVTAAPMSPAEAAPVTAFAKACRSAVRTLSLYPSDHPNIGAALATVTAAADRAAAAGPLHLAVLPDSLQVGGRPLARPDPSVVDLADLLHRHLVAHVTIQPHAPDDAWRRLLILLGTQPDQARLRGGIVKLWASEAEQSITLKQLDYRELLREAMRGDSATWEAVVQHCLAGQASFLDDGVMDLLLDVLNDPARAADLAAAVEERLPGSHGGGASGGAGGESGRGNGGALAIGNLLHAVAQFVGKVQPQRLESVLSSIAEATLRLPVPTMAGLMAARFRVDRPELAGFVENLAMRLKDAAVAEMIATEVRQNRGTSPDLATAVWGIAPDIDRREAVLTLSRQMLQESAALGDPASEQMWRQTEQLLMHYDHASYVGDPYSVELQRASDRAVDLERAQTDPPERVARWASTVAEDAVRRLDTLLLIDLLALRVDAAGWRDLAELVVSRIQVAIVVGDFTAASELAEALVQSSHRPEGHRTDDADRGLLERVLDATSIRHLASHLDTSDGEVVAGAQRLCHAIGTGAIGPLAQALAREERTRSRRHLVALLVSYGPAGRNAVEKLMQSQSAAVRRTAVVLLREFGGLDALPELESLLNDDEPHVQREATRAIAMLGIEPAFEIVAKALDGGTDATRGVVMNALWSLPLTDAAPVLAFVIRHTTPSGGMRDVHEKAIQRLGEADTAEAVAALEQTLHAGNWLSPFRTAALRRLAAESLARIGSSQAIGTLQQASASGSRGVRSAARHALKTHTPSAKASESRA